MKSFKKISTRIFVGIFSGMLILFTFSTIIDYYFTKTVINKMVRNMVDRTFNAAYSEINSEIFPVIHNAENSIYFLRNIDNSIESYTKLQKLVVAKFEGLIGSGVSVCDSKSAKFWSQYYSNDTIVLIKNDINCNNNIELFNRNVNGTHLNISLQYDTVSLNYYYFDSTSNIHLKYDFGLDYFIEILNANTEMVPSRFYLFDKGKNVIQNSTLRYSKIPENIQQKEIDAIAKFIKNNREGLYIETELERGRALYFAKLKGTDIILASSMQTNEVINRFRRFLGISYLISIAALIVLAYVLQRLIVRITRPITELTEISKKIQNGSLHTIVPEYVADGESAQISDALRTVQDKMKRYVSDLNSTLKQKRSLEHELKVANRIQLDMIPEADRALTELPEIDLYAKIVPAKGVAGDFYDYFFLDKKNLFFVIGDVSGKGIPAALFMVKTVTLIEMEARKHRNPAEVFKSVNEHLCLKNDEGMFVTAISGIINIESGEMELCDAGHNIPIMSLLQKEFMYTHFQKGRPLGMLTGGVYTNTTFKLSPKDTLVLYTDGFPECFGKADAILGEDALINELDGKANSTLTILANNLWSLIANFRQGTPASDDTTLLLIRYLGKLV